MAKGVIFLLLQLVKLRVGESLKIHTVLEMSLCQLRVDSELPTYMPPVSH